MAVVVHLDGRRHPWRLHPLVRPLSCCWGNAAAARFESAGCRGPPRRAARPAPGLLAHPAAAAAADADAPRRYARLYNAAIKDSAFGYAIFFAGFFANLAFSVWSAVGAHTLL